MKALWKRQTVLPRTEDRRQGEYQTPLRQIIRFRYTVAGSREQMVKTNGMNPIQPNQATKQVNYQVILFTLDTDVQPTFHPKQAVCCKWRSIGMKYFDLTHV